MSGFQKIQLYNFALSRSASFILGHTDYINNDTPLSPWRVVEGWHLHSCFHDPMHVLYLGTCRDLYASCLGYWIRKKYYGHGALAVRLREFSCELKEACRKQRIPGTSFL